MARMKRQQVGAAGQNGRLDSDAGVTETTHLLGAGAGETADRTVENDQSRAWDGLSDFEGLPWWRTPSVSDVTMAVELQAIADAACLM